jgi:hypothetical protein
MRFQKFLALHISDETTRVARLRVDTVAHNKLRFGPDLHIYVPPTIFPVAHTFPSAAVPSRSSSLFSALPISPPIPSRSRSVSPQSVGFQDGMQA